MSASFRLPARVYSARLREALEHYAHLGTRDAYVALASVAHNYQAAHPGRQHAPLPAPPAPKPKAAAVPKRRARPMLPMPPPQRQRARTAVVAAPFVRPAPRQAGPYSSLVLQITPLYT